MTKLTQHSSLELLDTKAVSQVLKVHPTTIARWRSKGEGPPFILIGKRAFYNLDQISAWMTKLSHPGLNRSRAEHQEL